jgi:predicted nucleic acid-binding protein
VNKKNYKILLDTSFLLPFIGFKTDEVVMNCIEKLKEYEVYYSELSILEALWKITKKIRELSSGQNYNNKNIIVEAVINGVKLIKRDLNKAEITEKSVKEAIKLYILGHRDLIDNILYGITATQEDMKFLTIDESLKAFIKNRNLKSDVFIEPFDL